MKGNHKLIVGIAVMAAAALGCQEQQAPTAVAERSIASSAHLTTYTANLTPLNPRIGYRGVTGKAVVTVNSNDGTVTVDIDARGLQPGMIHPQHIHGFVSGEPGSCPKPTADVNGDKVIDVLEGVPDYGPILLSLDGDFTNGPTMDVASFPNPDNRFGSIDYVGTGSIAAINAAIAGQFGSGAMLGPIQNRHIVLHGVSPDTDLPESVASIGDIPAYLTVPVACGELN